MWITAIRFDNLEHDTHQSIRLLRWRDLERQLEGEITAAELVGLIRAHTLVYVSDDVFERSAVVRVVDAKPPYLRSWAHGKWGNDLLVLPRF
jgi:uncharacterized protein DUF3892